MTPKRMRDEHGTEYFACLVSDVDVLQRQHQQAIEEKDETIGRWTQTGLTLMKFFAAFPVMNESDMPEFLWREVPTLIRSTRQAAAKAEARLAAVELRCEHDMARLVTIEGDLLRQRDDLRKEIEASDTILADRQRILDACPCPVHGPCVPYVLAMLEKQKRQREALVELAALVKGKCPSLLTEDLALAVRVMAALDMEPTR